MASVSDVRGLRSDAVGFHAVIRGDISDERVADSGTFGVWYSPAMPVDTSGAPHTTFPYTPGRDTYTVTRQQTDAEHVPVQAHDGDNVGTIAELPLPWDTVAHSSPADQVWVH